MQEDDCIIKLVNKYGPKKWSLIAQSMPGRIGKQCRERFVAEPAHIKYLVWNEEFLVLHQTNCWIFSYSDLSKWTEALTFIIDFQFLVWNKIITFELLASE